MPLIHGGMGARCRRFHHAYSVKVLRFAVPEDMEVAAVVVSTSAVMC